MKVIFIGCVESSYYLLESLLEANAEVVGVVTKESSQINSDFRSLVPLCNKYEIEYIFSKTGNDEASIEWMKNKSPEAIFCFGWSSLLRKDLIDLPSKVIVGFHPAALPKNRGRHPIIWALALGLKETASTFFSLEEKADSGSILDQKPVIISYEDNASTLYDKIMSVAKNQVIDLYNLIKNDRIKEVKQDDSSGTNHWRKRGRADGKIDFRMTSKGIYNLTRSLYHPYPGAHIETAQGDVKVWKVKELPWEEENLEPGKVLEVNDKTFIVKCFEGAVEVLEHEFKELPKVGDYL